jgi:hypothetical protein
MADIDARARLLAARQVADTGATHWTLHLAVGLVAALWATGCVWLFAEQARFAAHLGFAVPQVFPVIIDGGAFVSALLAYAVSLSGRTAGGSRLFSAAATVLSAAANGAGAWFRSHDATAVVVAALVPLVLIWAFHLILAEIRLRVRIRRGLPADKAPPALRPVRVLFAGRLAFYEWRAAGLAVTDPLPPLPPPQPSDDPTGRPATTDSDLKTAATGAAPTSTITAAASTGTTVVAAVDRPAVAAAGPDTPGAPAADDRTDRTTTTDTAHNTASTDTAAASTGAARTTTVAAAEGSAVAAVGPGAVPGAPVGGDRTGRLAAVDAAPGTEGTITAAASTGTAPTTTLAAADGPAVAAVPGGPTTSSPSSPAADDPAGRPGAADVDRGAAATETAATTVVAAVVGSAMDAAVSAEPDGPVARVATLEGRRKSAAAAAAARTARAEAALAQARDHVASFTAENGREPTGRELGEHFGRSEGWGLGVLRKLREPTPEETDEEGAG